VKSTGELYLCRKAILSHQRGLMPQRSTPVKLRTNLLQLILAVGAIWLGATFLTTIARAEDSADSGKIYVLTNKLAGNTIISLQRNQDGSLTRLEEISTGGLGSGPIPLPPPIGGPNPLDSQDALIATPDGRFLLAVNAGSNEVSVMVITKEGLVLADKVSSNGEFPVSLSLHGNLVYVLNSHGNPNINGFNLDDSGKLNPIPDSIRSAGSPTADPAQIAFSPDGNTLIVTERLANLIDIFQMSKNGTPDAHSQLVSNNHTPFGVSFGRGRIIAITETNERVPRIPVINGASVSTYRIESTGEVVAVSVAVPDHQSAACWIRFVPNGHFAYVSNTGSGTLSSYSVSPSGDLVLAEEIAADTGGPQSVPIDLAITPDGKFLYVLSSLLGTVQGYRIERDGTLKHVSSTDGFPISVQGIVTQ
jgi:6-phosphogluconolactonase